MTPRIIAIVLLFCTVYGMAQNYSWEDFVQEYTTDLQHVEEEDWQNYMEELKALHEHPLNINTATIEDLLFLPFLTERQIEEIHAYIYLHGAMQTLSELLLLQGMDKITRDKLALFVFPGEPAKKENKSSWLGRIDQSFIARTDIPLYYRKGYQIKNGYKGDALYQRLRYQLTAQRHIEAGIRIEKDAGESYYDTYGAYLQLKNLKNLKQAIIGDYRIGFGEGLVLGGSTWNSKSSPSMKIRSGIRPMKGMDEVNFMRGGGIQLNVGQNIELNLFASHRKVDATLNKKGEVETLVESGYHRTMTERKKKRNTSTTLVGGHLQWKQHGAHFGATGYYQQFSRKLNPGTTLHRRIYPRGRDFSFMSLNYGYSFHRFSAAGETAYSITSKAFATLHRAHWNISPHYILSTLHRYYSPYYHSFHAASLCENSNTQNENGLLLHLKSTPTDGWQVLSYIDFFYHKWPRYRMTRSSAGQEAMAQANYQATEKHALTFRYQIKRKEVANTMEPHHHLKLQWNYSPHRLWKLQTTGLWHQAKKNKGIGLQEAIRFNTANDRARLTFMGAYFHSPNYLSRLYFYEPNLYQSISSSTYYGHGMHYVLLARWITHNKKWMFEAKYSYCQYFDRTEIGSALQTIFSPQKHDISMLIKLDI